MHRKTDRNCFQRQRIAYRRRCILARHNLLTDRQPFRRDDITLFSVCICNKRDVRTTIRIVLNSLDRSWDTVLIALKVNHTILSFVSAALMTYRNTSTLTATTI